uniref:Uncharacterized protein n=1 Tax=Eutreptiella gymnastica TaxID=73025 RepID=A0A6U8IQN6_9EUGL
MWTNLTLGFISQAHSFYLHWVFLFALGKLPLPSCTSIHLTNLFSLHGIRVGAIWLCSFPQFLSQIFFVVSFLHRNPKLTCAKVRLINGRLTVLFISGPAIRTAERASQQ